jgi:peptide/nickel transport system permease protein
MTETELIQQTKTSLAPRNPRWEALSRVAKYSFVKALTLLITVTIGLYLTILIVNLGGFVDRVFSSSIDENIGAMIQGGWLRDVKDEAERTKIIEETRWAMQEAQGLHEPFLVRSLRWLGKSMTLDLGYYGAYIFTYSEEGTVQEIILRRMPYTLVLVGLSNLAAFLISILLALVLSRKPGSLLDRLTILLSPVTSAPNWIFGVLLIFIFATTFHILPYPKGFKTQSAKFSLEFFSFMGKYMIIPGSAVILSTVFQSVYAWRTFFLMYSQEDYVEVARAKGLSPRMIEARYILRPVLPYVVTSFAVMMILFWQSAIALEMLFLWPGLGSLFFIALRGFATPMVLGVVVVFAYLLAITVFVLDILYAVLDPRVRVGNQGTTMKAASIQKKVARLNWRPDKKEPIQLAGSSPPTPNLDFKNRVSLSSVKPGIQQSLRRLKLLLQEIAHFPSAIFGAIMILILISIAVYTIFAYPYNDVVKIWRSQGEDWYRSTWYKNPVTALPSWVNFFRKEKLPETLIFKNQDDIKSEINTIAEGITQTELTFAFNYDYSAYPQDLIIYLDSVYQEKPPFVTLFWHKPDGTVIDLGGVTTQSHQTYYLSRDEKLQRKLKTESILQTLFEDPASLQLAPLKGNYELVASVLFFEPIQRDDGVPPSSLDMEAILYGKVYGMAGTDIRRRDLGIAMLWGAPVALAFGLLGAIGTSLIAMTIAAVGAWYSGWVDELIQRLTEINMILPALPIALMVYFMYSKSIWVILSVVVLLNIFGSAIKNYRSVFLQARESPYIEAAQAYGTSNWRIISKYLVPRILPILLPQLVIMVPTYVFYEATLAYLGVSDPYLPTWGKTIYEALTNYGLQEHPYWVLEPLGLLLLTGLAFALLGFGLDRVLNPRLREE